MQDHIAIKRLVDPHFQNDSLNIEMRENCWRVAQDHKSKNHSHQQNV